MQGLELLAIGLVAGVMGGMLGIGGGLVMIPAMTILLGNRFGLNSFHLYKLAAITTSIVVSIPAAIRHGRAHAVVCRIVWAALPLSVVGVLLGVASASRFSGESTRLLKQLFGGFLELVVAFNLYQTWRTAHGDAPWRDNCPVANRRMLIGLVVGLPSGIIAGLLGIAGGIWAVPAQHLLLSVRLRNAIANSTLMIVVVATVTAVTQSVAVGRMQGLHPAEGWQLVLWLAPGAVAGGWIGADLTHRLPTRWLRHAFHALLAITGFRLIFY
jgi:uncharacterized membrane protein YfcA